MVGDALRHGAQIKPVLFMAEPFRRRHFVLRFDRATRGRHAVRRQREEKFPVRFEPAGFGPGVVVQKNHEPAAGSPQGGIARRAQAGFLFLQRADSRIGRRGGLRQCRRRVRRAVVDDQQFAIAIELRQHAGDGAGQESGAVAGADRDGEQRVAAAESVRRG